MPEAAIEERARMRMMNLSIELAEMHAGVLELEADELDGCSSEREVRAYYESDGADVPRGVIERRCKQAGGGRVEMSEASERRVGMEDMTKRSMLKFTRRRGKRLSTTRLHDRDSVPSTRLVPLRRPCVDDDELGRLAEAVSEGHSRSKARNFRYVRVLGRRRRSREERSRPSILLSRGVARVERAP